MSVEIQLFNTGYCVHPEFIAINGGSISPCKFHATFALIKHHKIGYILYDTGYSSLFYSTTKKFPFNLYSFITPVFHEEKKTALNQLRNKGIFASDINSIIISHFHADHICGLKDFPHSKLLALKEAYHHIRNKDSFSALKNGFIPELLPNDFQKRFEEVNKYPYINLDKQLLPFKQGFDIAGDSSIIGIPLEGHAIGHLGLLVYSRGQIFFFIGDACWLNKSYQKLIEPNPIANLIIANKKQFKANLRKIHQLHINNPNIKIIPSHAPETVMDYINIGSNNL